MHTSIGSLTVIALALVCTFVQGQDESKPSPYASDYNHAIKRVSLTVKNMLDESNVHVVWLFDESSSMRDDQREVAKQMERFDKVLSEDHDAQLMHSVASYAKSLHLHTRKPVLNTNEIKTAVNQIPVDKTGVENVFQAVGQLSQRLGNLSRRAKQQLLIVVVTDEAGNDLATLEACIASCKRQNVKVCCLGRSAMFASHQQRLAWKHPVTGNTHWVLQDRGPDSPVLEQLSYSVIGSPPLFTSGYAPFGLARLCKQTGGYFLLMPDTANRVELEHLDFMNYRPSRDSIREYQQATAKNPLRTAIIRVATRLRDSPSNTIQINQTYSANWADFTTQRKVSLKRMAEVLDLLNTSIDSLKQAAHHREAEKNSRWQANYDLMLARCQAERLRLISTASVLLAHRENVHPVKKKNNSWRLGFASTPTELGQSTVREVLANLRIKETVENFSLQLQVDRKETVRLLKKLAKDHHSTPWSFYAAEELRRGLAAKLIEFKRTPPAPNPKPPVL